VAQPTRRFAEFCFFLTFALGIATCVFGSMALFDSYYGGHIESMLWLSLGTSLCSLTTLSLGFILLRRVHWLTDARTIGAAKAFATLSGSPTIRHLLDSLDLQRRMMDQFFERAPFGVLMVRSDGTVAYANPLMIEMAGYRKDYFEEIGRRGVHALFASEPGSGANLLERLRQQDTTVAYDLYLLREDGTRLLTSLTAYPLMSGALRHDGYLLFVKDISPTQQLKLLQEQCSYLLNSMNHGLVVVDCAFQITFANEAFLRMFDQEPHDVLGETIETLIPDQTDEETEAISRRLAILALESGQNETATIVLPLPEGRFQHIQITATPIRDEFENNIGVLLHYQDRTTEHELIESMRRNDQLETVSQMAASIAHEVRNPMTSVQGFLQLISREVDPSSTHSMYLHVMEEDLKRINSIITEYLNFSRMGSDSLEDVWIGTLLTNTYTLLQSEANLKGIQMALLMSGDNPNPLLIANPNRLKQVLINLARNAMEAMIEQGGGTLTLALDSTEEHILLKVQDTGPGIDPAHLSRIFSPFYTTKKTGTGLGLYICKKIIDEHNGKITVTTENGVGTTFEILLPRNRLFERT
jgi:PAS domain S-box-containing protein